MSDTLLESVNRLKNSRIVPILYGWHGEDLKEMLEEMNDIGLENLDLRIFPGLDMDGTPEAWFRVVNKGPDKAKRPGNTYNVAYTCPPLYPPDCEPDCPPDCEEGDK